MCGDNNLYPTLITTKGYVGRGVGDADGVLNSRLYIRTGTCVCREKCFDPRCYVLKRSPYANKYNRLAFRVQCAPSVNPSFV
jgi:hypothetical protein